MPRLSDHVAARIAGEEAAARVRVALATRNRARSEKQADAARTFAEHAAHFARAYLAAKRRQDLRAAALRRERGSVMSARVIRERAIEYGANTLTDCEILAAITGLDPDHAALAGRRLGDLGSILEDRMPPAARLRLQAAHELAIRVARTALPEREPLAQPSAVAAFLALRYASAHQETMGALYLDSRLRLLAVRDHYKGTISRAAAEPRLFLREAIRLGAAGLILFHNHPSGDPTPSAEDHAFTRRMTEAGEAVGVKIVDHLVLGGVGRWVSLRERGSW